ncbi:hypothetical protein [Sphingomonas sp. LHG3406-1]|uniref:hypothetical protein n=1 Tax=Sphingomonas sp. LHG3406-1 TaxID=2804617 RepID=UPI0026207ABD|nr:hypothetical protein [Sphingomonas sp. LHG3406-1]
MELASLIGSALLLAPAVSTQVASASPGPPERIVLPVIQPGCDRTAQPDEIMVCGRTERRYRIDTSTLRTLRSIEDRDDPTRPPRPHAITQSCAGTGPMTQCTGALPVSDMALRAIGLAVKAIRGEDLRPALRQGPTDYEIYQRTRAEAEAKEEE